MLLAVEFTQQRLPVLEPADIQSVAESQRIDLERLVVRVAGDLPGIVLRAQEPGVLAGPGQWPLQQEGRQIDTAGNAIGPRTQERARGRVIGPVVPRRHLVEEPAGLPLTGQHVVRRHQVVVVLVRQRTDDRKPVGPGRQVRQVLTDAVPRNPGRHRIEVATDRRGGVRFHVKRVMVAGSTGQEDNHNLLGLAGHKRAGIIRSRRRIPTGQRLRQTQTREARIAYLKQFAPGGL